MAISDEVRRTALELAERDEETDAAITEILSCCGDRRVSLIRARQALSEGQGEDANGVTRRAIELIDLTLEHHRWA